MARKFTPKPNKIPVLICHVVGFDVRGNIVKRLEAYSEGQAMMHLICLPGRDGIVRAEVEKLGDKNAV